MHSSRFCHAGKIKNMLRLLPTLLSAISTDFGVVVRRKRRNFIGYCVSALFAMTAYIAGVMVLLTWLMQSNNPLMAWIMIGVICASLSLFVIASIMVLNYYEKRKNSTPSNIASTASLIAASQVAKSTNITPIVLALMGAYFAYSKTSKPENHDS